MKELKWRDLQYSNEEYIQKYIELQELIRKQIVLNLKINKDKLG